MTNPIKHCPQPDPPELVMRADGYHYQSEDEMKELTDEQIYKIWYQTRGIGTVAFCGNFARAAIAADRALNAADRDVMRQAPEGWKLVPIEPTDAMKERGSNCAEYGHDDIYPESAADVYRAMLAVAPTPPAERPDDDTLSPVYKTADEMVAALDAEQPVELSPEFTDTARGALLWVLWHHQGANSPVGQPIRFALGMGRDDHLMPHQIAEAKQWDAIQSAEQRGCKGKNCGCTDGVSHSEECLAEHAATIDQAVRAEQQGEQEPVAWLTPGGDVTRSKVFADEQSALSFGQQRPTPLYTQPSPSLAELRAKVEALAGTAGTDLLYRRDVLAEIDKLGGKV